MEVEEKVDADLDRAMETWTDKTGGGTSVTRQNQTFACDQSKDTASVPEAEAGDAIAVGDGSDWYRSGEEGAESVTECPTLERCVCQTSVIVCVQGSGEMAVDATVCSAAPAGKEEAEGDNRLVSQAAPAAAEHARKVIVTNVTINSLTVTFKEATVAEGFFKGY